MSRAYLTPLSPRLMFKRSFSIFLTFFITLVLSPTILLAEPIGLGFPQYDPSRSFLTSNELLPTFVRLAVTAPLANTRSNSEPRGLRHVVSEASSVSADYREWSYRLSSIAKFSNGEFILPEDVVFSLERCATVTDNKVFLSALPHREARPAIAWVKVNANIKDADGAKQFATWISNCPIIERSSALLFGSELGLGSNIVSSGSYVISGFLSGKKISLTRNRGSSIDRAGPEEFEVRAFSDSDQGLAALRIGTILGFATSNSDIIKRSQNDETLALESCAGYWMVRRRGAKLNCIESLDILQITDQG